MTKVLVLYYSSFGHMEQMANAAADGAREAGAQAVVKRVPELVPEEVAIGAACRWFDIPSPAPPKLVGALLVVAMTMGFLLTDRLLESG
jgi:NAD(P)H dehydrogenase (quinone)